MKFTVCLMLVVIYFFYGFKNRKLALASGDPSSALPGQDLPAEPQNSHGNG